MDQNTKKLLIYVCISVIIIIIVRVIYLNIILDYNNYNDNYNKYNNIESFKINNNNAVDLLSTKLKSIDALQSAVMTSTDEENNISPWNNKSDNSQIQKKAISFYKPNLNIKNVKYCKLGDMVSQDIKYNSPSPTEFTLLIKKIGSDIKSPTSYDLIVDINNRSTVSNTTVPNTTVSNTTVSNTTTVPNTTVPYNTNSNLPLQIYNPIPPSGYVSLGHVFCNVSDDLKKIRSSQNVACVPANCVKEIRDWLTSDKIFEYNNNNEIYWAIFFNPYTGTFISTNTQQLPTGKVCKVVACVAKCTAVDDLKKADECARKYYNLNKAVMSSTPIIPNLVSEQEEEFYLSKIKAQSDSIAKLGERAQQMQITIDKANIINREMNKNKLQTYVDTQKKNIDIIMKRLIEDRNKIKTNVNISTEAINTIINSPDIPYEQKLILIKKIKEDNNTNTNNNMNEVLNSLPLYDLEGLVKKTVVSDVCYGCGEP